MKFPFVLSLLLIFNGLGASWTVRAEAGKLVHRTQAGDYVVEWDRPSANAIFIYRYGYDRSGDCNDLKPVYEYENESQFFDGAAPWYAPVYEDGGYPSVSGVLLTLTVSAGSGRWFVILANTKRGFRPVFKAFSDRAGGGHPLEMVDLDGDTYPEIVCVPSYYVRRDGPLRAQVWKWSVTREEYLRVREGPYSERLRPLRFRRRVKSKAAR